MPLASEPQKTRATRNEFDDEVVVIEEEARGVEMVGLEKEGKNMKMERGGSR